MNLFTKLTLLTASCISLNGFCADKVEEKSLDLDVQASFLYIGDAKFKDGLYKDKDLSYRTGRLMIGYTYELDQERSIISGLGYQTDRFSWEENPAFSDTTYSNIIFQAGMSTKEISNWYWKGILSVKLDSDLMNLQRAAIYNAALHGIYDYAENIDVHIGLLGTTGIRKDSILPILGLRYLKNDWTFSAVFPIDASVKYQISEKLAGALAYQPFYHRHRLGAEATVSRGIMEYRASGVKAEATYDYSEKVHLSASAGYNFGGDIKVRDENGDNPRHYKFESTPFVGADVRIEI